MAIDDFLIHLKMKHSLPIWSRYIQDTVFNKIVINDSFKYVPVYIDLKVLKIAPVHPQDHVAIGVMNFIGTSV